MDDLKKQKSTSVVFFLNHLKLDAIDKDVDLSVQVCFVSKRQEGNKILHLTEITFPQYRGTSVSATIDNQNKKKYAIVYIAS